MTSIAYIMFPKHEIIMIYLLRCVVVCSHVRFLKNFLIVQCTGCDYIAHSVLDRCTQWHFNLDSMCGHGSDLIVGAHGHGSDCIAV